METKAHRLSARFWALIAATFLGFLGFGTVLPRLAIHVRHDFGGTDRTVGFVIGTFSAVALASRLFAGRLADHRGRKAAFLVGLVSCGFAGLSYLLPIGIPGMYLGRALQGMGEACLYTGAAAWAIELAGVHRSARALGFLSSGIWGGISAGPVIGQFLVTFEQAAMFQTFAALASFLLLLKVPEGYQRGDHPRVPWFRKSILPAGMAVGFVNVHYPVITGFLVLHLASHGDSGAAAFSTYALFVLLSRFFLGGLPDRIPAYLTYYGGLALMIIGLTVLATAPAYAGAIAGAACLGLGFSFPWASVASTAMRDTPNQERGSTVSILSAFYDIFVGISSFSAGIVANRYGYPAAFIMAIAALFAAAVAGRFVFVKTAKPAALYSKV